MPIGLYPQPKVLWMVILTKILPIRNEELLCRCQPAVLRAALLFEVNPGLSRALQISKKRQLEPSKIGNVLPER